MKRKALSAILALSLFTIAGALVLQMINLHFEELCDEQRKETARTVSHYATSVVARCDATEPEVIPEKFALLP